MRLIPIALLALLLAGCGGQDTPTASAPEAAPAPEPAATARPAEKLAYPATFRHPDAAASSAPAHTIVFLTDDGEHGWMQHENTAGAVLLAKRLAAAVPGCEAIVLRDTFPDQAMLDRASSLVLFCSGTDRHPLNDPAKLAALDAAMRAGKGMVAIHWALEAGTPEGTKFLADHLGGFFEVDFSVNPMWKADFTFVPPHETTRGVAPFSIYDEFYFNMRFPETTGKRSTILEAIPPKRVILLPEDGPRSNNPTVRGSLGQPHVTGWVFDRPGGGRSFGFTGGHFHWDWKHDDYRRVVLNAIAWTAGIPIPENGLPDTTPTDAELFENQDSEPMPGWKPMPGQPGITESAPAPQA